MSLLQNKKAISWGILVLLALIWGSSYILIKRALVVFEPTEIAGLRMLAATLLLFPFALKYVGQIKPNQWKYVFLVGLLGNGIPAFLFPMALKVVNSATGGILNSLTPLFTLIVASLFFGLAFPRRRVIGVIIGFAGAVLLVASGTNGAGDNGSTVLQPEMWERISFSMFIVLATVCYAFSTNITKRFFNHTNSILLTAYAVGFMAVPYSVYLLFSDVPALVMAAEPETLNALGYVALLGAFGTGVSLVLYYRLVQITDPVFSSSVTYMVPIVAIMWGVWDGEYMGVLEVLGMFIILFGVYLVNKK